jgi:hypothetical protein
LLPHKHSFNADYGSDRHVDAEDSPLDADSDDVARHSDMVPSGSLVEGFAIPFWGGQLAGDPLRSLGGLCACCIATAASCRRQLRVISDRMAPRRA